LDEMWQYQELVTRRGILVRGKQAVMGIAWAVLHPGLSTIAFTFMFGRFMGTSSQSHSVPCAVSLYGGLLPGTYFASGVHSASILAVRVDTAIALLVPLFRALNEGIADLRRVVFAPNPMTQVTQRYRRALLGGTPPGAVVRISVAETVVQFVGGLFYFKRIERVFADVV